MEKPIYLDYNATTPLDSEVLNSMLPYFKGEFGNPSSQSHCYGWEAKMAVDTAKQQVASLIGAKPSEVICTSGATESDNLAILGVTHHNLFHQKKPHIITCNTEHKAVLDVCRFAEKLGVELTILPVNHLGQVSAEQVEKAIQANTVLVTLMMANNEIGSIHPIKQIGKVTRKHKIYLHTDAAQSIGRVKINVDDMNIDLLSISGHKIYGPKGVGALYVRSNPKVELEPLMFGGSQEGGLRPGTLNVPGIVGLGKACEMAEQLFDQEVTRLCLFRDRIIETIQTSCPNAQLNGHPTERLCNNVSFSFDGLSADMFSLGLSGIAVSSGSACTSASASPSHVLSAIGHPKELAKSTIRIGLGRHTTEKDIEFAIQKIISLCEKNKEISVS